jgi:hypothetical protein
MKNINDVSGTQQCDSAAVLNWKNTERIAIASLEENNPSSSRCY